jgi:hypothetical protein
MNGPVRINGGAPLDPPTGSGDDPAYLLPLHERAFRARCEARLMLYQSGDMTWEETGFPDELMPADWFDILDLQHDSVLEIAIGPVEQLDNMLARVGPEAAERYPSIRALLIDLNDDEFKTLAHDLHADRPDHAAWTCDEIKELARIRRRHRHG